MSCDEIEVVYENFHVGEYASCEFDNDCIAVWGACDVGLGGCHYSVNEENYPQSEINDLVDLWLEEDCMSWVCDCSSLPYADCVNGSCSSAYCMDVNPVGCFAAGCPDGFECIDVPNACVPSLCSCDQFYGEWWCTEDCGGGTCVASGMIGDLNSDGELNIIDIVLVVNMILYSEYDVMGDLNLDGQLNVVDIILLVSLVLNT
jgi:hypothetical protein